MRLIQTNLSGNPIGATPVISLVGDYGALPYPDSELNIVVSGQSNAVSRNTQGDTISDAPELPYTGYLKNCQYWNDTNGQLENYKLVMNQYLADVNGDYGIEYSMAKTLMDNRFVGNVNLLKFAEGGTAIGTDGGFGKWNPITGVRTPELITMLGNYPNDIDYFVWFQGETDTLSAVDGAAYEQNLQDLMDLFRANKTINNVIIVYLASLPAFGFNVGTAGVRAGQTALVANNSWAHMVTPDISTYTFPDPSHYSLDGIRDIGNLCANLIMSL